MSNSPVTTLCDKILSAIKRNGTVTATEIRRSISEFNQTGGAEKLHNFLADLVSKGVISAEPSTGGNGRVVKSYSLSNSSNDAHSSVSDNVKITCTFEIVFEGLAGIFSPLFSQPGTANGNCDERNAELTADEIELPEVEDDPIPFGNDDYPIPFGDGEGFIPFDNDYDSFVTPRQTPSPARRTNTPVRSAQNSSSGNRQNYSSSYENEPPF